MDFTNILATLTQGNNPLLLILAFFLFKDQIFALFKPKPVDPIPPPVVLPGPVPVVAPEHPLVDQIIKTVLPLLVDLVLKQVVPAVKAQARAEAEVEQARSLTRGE